MTTRITNSVLDLERLDWSRHTNCFVCNNTDTPVSNGIFYEPGSNAIMHACSTNVTGHPEGSFYNGNLDGSAFRCPHCGPYIVSGTLMVTENASERIRDYLDTHPEYRDAPKVIHTFDVGVPS